MASEQANAAAVVQAMKDSLEQLRGDVLQNRASISKLRGTLEAAEFENQKDIVQQIAETLNVAVTTRGLLNWDAQ